MGAGGGVSAAPSIMGSPNIVMMLGAPPDYALRLIVVGTALLPLTVLPVFAVMPSVHGTAAIGQAAMRLMAMSVLTAMTLQSIALRHASDRAHHRLEGVSARALAVFVIGLMPRFQPWHRKPRPPWPFGWWWLLAPIWAGK